MSEHQNRALQSILSELEAMNLSSITETGSGQYYTSAEFKSLIRSEIFSLYNDYEIRNGQSVVIFENNSINFFIHFIALFCIGATAVPLDSKLSDQERDNILKTTDPVLLISKERKEQRKPKMNPVFSGQALMLFTSGTTSHPKGVLISKEALLRKMEVMAKFISKKEIENTLCFVPTFFGHGLICNSLFPIFNSINFYVCEKMSLQLASEFTSLIEKFQINFFSSVPSHWEMILEFAEKYKGTSLKRVHCASAPLKKEKLLPIKAWAGSADLYDIYGATEMLGWFASRKVDSVADAGKFDTYWDVQTSLSENNELLLKSDYMASGYWDGQNFNPLHSFNTGDIFDTDRLVGRSKNVIIKNGMKISTDDLNSEILTSGLVKDVATFPVDDNFTGENVGVFVVLAHEVELKQLKDFCRKHLPAHKLPQIYNVVEKIPVNSRGKCSLKELKNHHEKMNEP